MIINIRCVKSVRVWERMIQNGGNIINYESGTIQLLTTLRINLIAFKTDPEGQKSKLYDVVTHLQDYLLLLAREVIPNIEDIQSKSYLSKGDVPEVTSRTVSKALDIAGLNEDEVDQFVGNLEA